MNNKFSERLMYIFTSLSSLKIKKSIKARNENYRNEKP